MARIIGKAIVFKFLKPIGMKLSMYTRSFAYIYICNIVENGSAFVIRAQQPIA